MALTTLGRSTRVPTDRDVQVTVAIPAPADDVAAASQISRLQAELQRHLAVSATRNTVHSSGGAVRSVDVFVQGRPFRAWTRGELEAQLRYLRIRFNNISIRSETESSAAQVARRARDALAALGPGAGVAGLVAADEQAREQAEGETSNGPIIAGAAAIVIGVGIAIAVVVWS